MPGSKLLSNWPFWEVQIRFKPTEKEGESVSESKGAENLSFCSTTFAHPPARRREGRLITQAIPESRTFPPAPARSDTQKIHERVLKMKAGKKAGRKEGRK